MSRSSTTILIILGTLLVSAALIFGFATPIAGQITTANLARFGASVAAADIEAQRETLTTLAADRATNTAFRDRLAGLIPAVRDTDDVIVTLEDVSRALELELQVISILTKTSHNEQSAFTGRLPEGVAAVEVNVIVAGAFPSLTAFLEQLAIGDRLLEIGPLNITADEAGTLQTQLAIRAFWKEKTTIEATNQTLTIDPAFRARLLAPRAVVPVTPPTGATPGRPDPFAPVP